MSLSGWQNVCEFVRSMTMKAGGAADHPQRHRLGRVVAAGPDGTAVSTGHGGGEARRGDVHQRGPGPRCDPRPQRRRLRGTPPRVQGRSPEDFALPERRSMSRRSPSPSRPSTACRSRPGAWPSRPTSWSTRGVVDDISHEALRVLLREEAVSFQRVKTGRPRATPTTPRRRPLSSTSARSPTARSSRRR